MVKSDCQLLMLLFNSHRLLLCPPTNVGHQAVVGDDAQWRKVFVRITYRLQVIIYCGYDATMSALKNVFALFSQVRHVHGTLFS